MMATPNPDSLEEKLKDFHETLALGQLTQTHSHDDSCVDELIAALDHHYAREFLEMIKEVEHRVGKCERLKALDGSIRKRYLEGGDE